MIWILKVLVLLHQANTTFIIYQHEIVSSVYLKT